jgi:hypothetical protein
MPDRDKRPILPEILHFYGEAKRSNLSSAGVSHDREFRMLFKHAHGYMRGNLIVVMACEAFMQERPVMMSDRLCSMSQAFSIELTSCEPPPERKPSPIRWICMNSPIGAILTL